MAVSEEECSSAKSRSSSSTSSSTYYLAKCVLRGTVVLQVLYGHIRSPTSLDVVFGKIGVPKILDGDLLTQFLEFTSMQQESVLSSHVGSPSTVKPSSKLLAASIPINQVVQLLERFHYALN